MPEAWVITVEIAVFVYADHAVNKALRRSQTGVLIFLNKSPIHGFRKLQTSVEVITFGAELSAMKVAV